MATRGRPGMTKPELVCQGGLVCVVVCSCQVPASTPVQHAEPATDRQIDVEAADTSADFVGEEVPAPSDDEDDTYPEEPPPDWKRYVPAPCHGSRVDLLETLSDCPRRFPVLPISPQGPVSLRPRCEPANCRVDLRNAMRVRLAPHASLVQAGATVQVDVILENVTNDRLPIVSRAHPRYEIRRCTSLIEIRDAAGKGVTCNGITGSGTGPRGDSLVVLDPRG
jgi:hypothetical protein